jgi:hypothetical protein
MYGCVAHASALDVGSAGGAGAVGVEVAVAGAVEVAVAPVEVGVAVGVAVGVDVAPAGSTALITRPTTAIEPPTTASALRARADLFMLFLSALSPSRQCERADCGGSSWAIG